MQSCKYSTQKFIIETKTSACSRKKLGIKVKNGSWHLVECLVTALEKSTKKPGQEHWPLLKKGIDFGKEKENPRKTHGSARWQSEASHNPGQFSFFWARPQPHTLMQPQLIVIVLIFPFNLHMLAMVATQFFPFIYISNATSKEQLCLLGNHLHHT